MNNFKNSSVFDIIQYYTCYLKEHNIENAKFESELILCELLTCNKIDLYTKTQPINKIDFNLISEYINRRIKGEPIQYILEKAYFYGNQFKVNPHVLIPRFDSEVLIDILKKYRCVNDLLDVGTGSGNLAITIAKEQLANNIIATDISEKQLKIAKYNNHNIYPEKTIHFIVDDFLNSNLNQKFDIIVSNPPYIPKNELKNLDGTVKNHEPKNALTDGGDGYSFYRQFAKLGPHLLKDNGSIFLEIGINNSPTMLKNIFNDYKINIFNDLDNIARIIQLDLTV